MKVLSVILDIILILMLVWVFIGTVFAEAIMAPWVLPLALAVFIVWAIVALIRHIIE